MKTFLQWLEGVVGSSGDHYSMYGVIAGGSVDGVGNELDAERFAERGVKNKYSTTNRYTKDRVKIANFGRNRRK